LTYGIGRTFIHHFESGGNFLTVDAAAMRQRFTTEFNHGRKIVQGWFGSKAAAAAEQPAGHS
jgi:hypothetical protein